MILKILEHPKIDYNLPTVTLDVNQVALRNPAKWPPEFDGLAQFEWNYFMLHAVELCVTLQTPDEITKGVPPDALGSIAYDRFRKSQLFKSRPPGTTLSLTAQESNVLWSGIRSILFPTVDDAHLTPNHRADANQIFYHTVASGSLSSSAFITNDRNTYSKASELRTGLGIQVLRPFEAWRQFQGPFNLYSPTEEEKSSLWFQQQTLLQALRAEAGD